MRSAVSVLYLIILQILWVFRSLYESVVPGEKTKNANPENLTETTHNSENERRHLIHLFTTRPTQHNGRPVCYMHVCEILTPHEEEMLRCVCAKGAYNTRNHWNNSVLPDGRISRAAFTNAWMESFSLVI